MTMKPLLASMGPLRALHAANVIHKINSFTVL